MLLIYEPTERANPTEMLMHSYLAELMNPAAPGVSSTASATVAGLPTGSTKVGGDGAMASGPMEVASGAEGANVVGGEVEVGGARR
jgi:hypothetical protein